MITHVVLLRAKRPVSEESVEELLARLREFGAEPPHAIAPAVVRRALVLRSDGPSSTEASIEVRFADADAFRAYLADPRHLALVSEVLEPFCESWLSIQTDD